ncbi:hypothetical protein [Paenibacillus xylanilyticus]|uniref:hypothetical protein n=1 Tax=Paenibacillus xylanilyticus TaxID=248903 RepID=UPI00129E6B57|nr:hypothetical protein [Paenibacillus xylanilyticus]
MYEDDGIYEVLLNDLKIENLKKLLKNRSNVVKIGTLNEPTQIEQDRMFEFKFGLKCTDDETYNFRMKLIKSDDEGYYIESIYSLHPDIPAEVENKINDKEQRKMLIEFFEDQCYWTRLKLLVH